MKQTMRKLISLLLAALLTAVSASVALAETAQEQHTGYIVTGYRYANGADGQLTLQDDQGSPIGEIANGARLTLTNGEKDGYVYVRFGAVSGWALAAELSEEASRSNEAVQAPALTPIQTAPPEAEDNTPGEEAKEEVPAAEESAPVIEEDADTATQEKTDAPTAGDEPSTETADADPSDESDPLIPDTDSKSDDPSPSAVTYENTHEPIPALYANDDGSAETVQVVLLGAVTSLLDTDEGILPVDTMRLTFSEEADENKKLGYVHAPRTGKAGLREEADRSGKVITQLKAGQLVAVLALEEEFAHVNAQGQEGWLRLDCLRYLEPAGESIVSTTGKEEPLPADKPATTDTDEKDVLIAIDGQAAKRSHYPRTAMLSCQSETTGDTSVNLRNLPTKESAKTAVWRTGEEVTVLSHTGGWYLVEANGTCGYVMEAFITFEE